MTAASRGQPDRGDKTAGRRRASGRVRWGQRERRREGKRHGSHGTHGRQEERRTSGGKAGREGGERDTDGLAPGEWRRGTRQQAGSRERTKKKRYINI